MSALIRTLAYLKHKQQDHKLSVMKGFACAMGLFIIMNVLALTFEVFFHLFKTRDEVW